jgi:predicted ATPase
MITRLSVRNFKSWRETKPFRLAPITVLFGTNSSGKTSLLQMLLMLKQTVDSPDRGQVLNLGDDRSLAELGTFKELLFMHDNNSPMEWEMEWKLPQLLIVEDPARQGAILFKGDSLGFAAKIAWRGNGDQRLGKAVVLRMAYSFSGIKVGMNLAPRGKLEYDLFQEDNDFRFVRSAGRVWKLPPPAKCYGFPDQVRAYYQNAGFLSDFELQFEKLFSRLFYLGPLRDYPKRQYSWAGAHPTDMGLRGEKVVDALLASREAGETLSRGRGHKRETLEERVAQCLKDLGLIEKFEVRAITPAGKLFQVWVRRHSQATEVLITDVGFGVSQIVPVITSCYYAPEGSTLLLEQPEIHLHPAVQAGLADVIIDAMQTRGIQIILESHSEHLLRRLQRRVAEEKLKPEDIALYFCSIEKGESQLTPLQLDLYGTINNWPKDFFGDEFGEIAAMSQATLARKKGKVG